MTDIDVSLEPPDVTVGMPALGVTVEVADQSVNVGMATQEVAVSVTNLSVDISMPAGPPGPPGPPGSGGGGSGVQVTQIDQAVPSAVWILDVGRTIGAIRVINSAGDEVEPGGIDQEGATAVRLTFSAAFSGTAYVTG